MVTALLALLPVVGGQSHLVPRIHFTRACVNSGGGSRDISGAITLNGTHHSWQLCAEGWHHATSKDLVHWESGGVDLKEWPSGFVVAGEAGEACAGFEGASGAGLVLRCAKNASGASWSFGAPEPMFDVDFYRSASPCPTRGDADRACFAARRANLASRARGPARRKPPPRAGALPLDPFRPFRDRDGLLYAGVALDACNGTTRRAPCAAGGALELWASETLRGGAWTRVPRPMLATNATIFPRRWEAHEFVTVEYLGFGDTRVLLNNA